MKKQSHKTELVTSHLFLVFMFIASNIYDAVTSLWAVNFSGMGMYEENLLIAESDGQIDVTRLFVIVPLGWTWVVVLAILYKIGRKPEIASHASFISLYKDHWVFQFGLLFLYGNIYSSIYVALINNSYVFIAAYTGLPGVSRAVFWPLYFMLVTLPSLYTHHCVLWRYLTDEAKAKYRYLAWPYRKGWMHEWNLKLT